MARTQNVFLIPIVTLVVGFAGGLLTGAAVAPKSETTHAAVSVPVVEVNPKEESTVDKNVLIFMNVSSKIADELEKAVHTDVKNSTATANKIWGLHLDEKKKLESLPDCRHDSELLEIHDNVEQAIQWAGAFGKRWQQLDDMANTLTENQKEQASEQIAHASDQSIKRISIIRKLIDSYRSKHHLP